MSDTPRTDEQINGKPCTRFEVIAGDSLRNASVPSEFARQLERELNAANSRIGLLMSANADVARIAGERDAAERRIRLLIAERDTARLQADQKHSLRDEFQLLLGTDKIEEGIEAVKEMKRRIQQLEEVAEDLVEESDIYIRRQEWRKAKEAKP